MEGRMIGQLNSFSEDQYPSVHDHFCFLYENEDQWKSFTTVFIATGLTQGEKCL